MGEVGLLLGYISLTVGQHVRQVLHKMVGLLFQDFLTKETQVNQVAYQIVEDAVSNDTSNSSQDVL